MLILFCSKHSSYIRINQPHSQFTFITNIPSSPSLKRDRCLGWWGRMCHMRKCKREKPGSKIQKVLSLFHSNELETLRVQERCGIHLKFINVLKTEWQKQKFISHSSRVWESSKVQAELVFTKSSLWFVGGHSVPAVSSHGCPSVFVCPWFSSSSSIDEDSDPTKSESHSHDFL